MTRILCAILFLAASFAVQACSCIDQSIEVKVEESSSAFVGLVVSAKLQFDTILIEARVIERFKGAAADYVTLKTSTNTAGCGWGSISVNSTYLFYTGSDGGFGVCSGTKELYGGKHAEELEKLRSLKGKPNLLGG